MEYSQLYFLLVQSNIYSLYMMKCDTLYFEADLSVDIMQFCGTC
jgi:hypothetical protein